MSRAYSHRELAERYIDFADGPVNLYEGSIPSVNELQLQILKDTCLRD